MTYQQNPPYYIQKSPEFSWDDIFNSFKYAENEFGLNFFPDPFLDLAYKNLNSLPDYKYSKIILNNNMSESLLNDLSSKLTNPYQLYVYDNISSSLLKKTVNIFTQYNPSLLSNLYSLNLKWKT
jgi:hypothetical protein